MTDQNQANERRHHQRIPFVADVIIRHDDRNWSCVLEGISLKGLLLLPPSEIAAGIGDQFSIELVLGEEASIRMQAVISHLNNNHWGLKWENIDLDGLTHLRRLLELNMDDPESMHRELSELG